MKGHFCTNSVPRRKPVGSPFQVFFLTFFFTLSTKIGKTLRWFGVFRSADYLKDILRGTWVIVLMLYWLFMMRSTCRWQTPKDIQTLILTTGQTTKRDGGLVFTHIPDKQYIPGAARINNHRLTSVVFWCTFEQMAKSPAPGHLSMSITWVKLYYLRVNIFIIVIAIISTIINWIIVMLNSLYL